MSNTRKISLASAALLAFVAATAGANAAGVAYIQSSNGSSAELKAAEERELAAYKALRAVKAEVDAEASRRHLLGLRSLTVTGNSPDAKVQQAQAEFDAATKAADAAKAKASSGSQSSPTTSIPEIPNSDSNYLDDHLMWDTPVYVYAKGSSGGIDLSKKYCLPGMTNVVGMKSSFTSATPATASDTDKQQTAANYLPVKLDSWGNGFLDGKKGPVTAILQQDSDAMCTSSTATDAMSIGDNTEFYVAADDLDNIPVRYGWDFGTLVVPFKFELSGNNAILSSATVGGYIGYRMPINLLGLTFRPVVFGGLSEIPTSEVNSSGTTDSQTVAGVSWGAGLLTTVKDSFNIGIVAGFDHATSSQHFDYQDHPWVAIEIGYSFTK